MSKIEILKGEIFKDHRGQISSLNNFHFEGVKRTYIIHHPDTSVIRGWHAHQHERKWFYCTKGHFTLRLVKIDNFVNPSADLVPEVFELNENESQLVIVPAGYANWVKAEEKDSILTVYSDKTIEEAKDDSWRYDSQLWLNNK